ncbi:hypothetical protein DB346_06925 [Verrucomicrobia bacterium LW23]|nr:hypothetical protein DB346_06925 [Verrucomicrobia bacterium LW23]
MRIFSQSTLRDFWERHADSEEPLLAWYRHVERAQWSSFQSVKTNSHSYLLFMRS